MACADPQEQLQKTIGRLGHHVVRCGQRMRTPGRILLQALVSQAEGRSAPT
jgi:hypothetical protein